MNRIEREKITIEKMIKLYCKKNHSSNILCEECNQIHQYAINRLTKCPYKEKKPICKNCSVHCYKKDYREKMKEIMRFSGPRMLFKHPILAIRHLFDEKLKRT